MLLLFFSIIAVSGSLTVLHKASFVPLDLKHLKRTALSKYPELHAAVDQFIMDNDREVSFIVKKKQLPLFSLGLSRNDIAHFSDLYQKYEDPAYGDPYYEEHNKWRNAKLIYKDKTYNIKIKAHGKAPSGHRAGKYMSFSIKLKKERSIWNATRFNLIIYNRIQHKRLLIFDLARRFNVLVKPDDLVRVKINNWEEKLYYFEHRLNNEYMESRNRASYKIFGNRRQDHKSSILTYEDEFEPEEFSYYFNEIFQKQDYPESHREAIYHRYLDINQDIMGNKYRSIGKYFDMDYITSFSAARTIAGHTGHGYTKINFYVYDDIASGRFYPVFTRDNIPSELQLPDSDPIEKQINYWDHLDSRQRLFDLIDRNDILRQEKYKRIYRFIEENGGTIGERHKQIIADDNKMHYFGWIRLLLNKMGMGIDVAPTGHNVEVLKSYLEKSSPELGVSTSKNILMIDILPRSMAAVGFSRLVLKQPPSILSSDRQVGFMLFTSVSGKTRSVSEKAGAVSFDTEGIHLTDFVKDIEFSSAVGREAVRVPRRYHLIFSFDDDVRLSLGKSDLVMDLENLVTGKKIGPENITELYDQKADIDSIYKTDIEREKDVYAALRENNSNIHMTITGNRELIIHRGTYLIRHDLVIPEDLKLIIEAGTNLLLGENIALVGYRGIEIKGTAEDPVTVNSIDPDRPFGSIGIMGDGNTISIIRHLRLSHGNERWINGIYFSGGLSLHYNGEVDISDSIISANHADDGLNIKYSNRVTIKNSRFEDNFSDQVDLDYCTGTVISSRFLNNIELSDDNSDGLDVSGSRIIVKDNDFIHFSDKGLSVGENSSVLVYHNTFQDNINAVAVKDLSNVYFMENRFERNSVDINAYQKKPLWGGGAIYVLPGKQAAYQPVLSVDKRSHVNFFPEGTAPGRFDPDNGRPDVQAVFDALRAISYRQM